MRKLFEEGTRSHLFGRRPGEGLYWYYGVSGRRGFDEFRALVNFWISEMPADEAERAVAEMQSGSDMQFEATLLEVMTHATLLRLGYRVECHPPLANGRRPDFLALNSDGRPFFYVETTTINPPSSDVSADNREASVQKAIGNANIARDLCFGYSLERSTISSPRLNRLVRDVECWAQENTEAARRLESIVKLFEIDGWCIELSLHALSVPTELPSRIAATSGEVRWLSPAADIRKRAEAKARAYGDVGLPLVLVVADRTDSLGIGVRALETELTEALLGDEVHTEQLDRAGNLRTSLVRRGGLWFSGGKPTNRNLSAMLVLRDAQLWNLRSSRGHELAAFNPWADIPLQAAHFPLRHYRADAYTWRAYEGRVLADVLDLPEPWPP